MGTQIKWDITVVHSSLEAFSAALKIWENTDYIGVFGGDGTLMQVAKALYLKPVPLVIFPGGTANVVAKELKVPLNLEKAIESFSSGKFSVRTIDMGLVNNLPFLIRLNMGILENMVTDASHEMKEHWGQFAYALSAFKNLNHDQDQYKITLDGESFLLEAVALTVTNFGNIGIQGFSFLPGIQIDDGFLDLIVLTHADFGTLVNLTGSTLMQNDSSILKHWKAREIIIEMDKPESFLWDDRSEIASRLDIKIAPKSLHVLIPNL